MSRTKTKYRKYAEGGSVPLTAEVDTPASHLAADVATSQLMDAAETAQHSVSMDVPSDDASVAFQHQIDALRQAEAKQRQRQGMPQTRADRIAQWRSQGFSRDQAEYFNELKENPEITHQAVMRARQDGPIDENSQAFHDKVRANFQLLQGVHPADVKLDEETPPKVSGAHEPVSVKRHSPVLPEVQNNPSLFSAPVSRETSANGGRDSYGERPGQVRMTPAMKEHARISGISEAEYAENVLRLRQEKKDGFYGGQP